MSNSKYKDIIGLPRHVSDKHPPMSMNGRAAQFQPFESLPGLSEALRQAEREAAERIKDDKTDPSDGERPE